jgi:hypothetical protein
VSKSSNKENRSVIARPQKHPLSGRLIVVGGQCRKVGKTTLIVDIIKATPDLRWTAVKITPHAESHCPVNGSDCKCAPAEHTFSIYEEVDRSGRTGTSRYLLAGAQRSMWVQTKDDCVQDVLGRLAETLNESQNVIVESDALVKFWRPAVFLMVLDSRMPEFKASAKEVLPLADAFVFRSPSPQPTDPSLLGGEGRPSFLQPMGKPLPLELQAFLMHPLGLSAHPI